jgi:hypothetical protein
MPDLDRIDGPITLDDHDRMSLKVLLDAAIPREPGGPMDWEGAGRRYAESLLGFRAPCTCNPPREDLPPAPGCPVHDPVDEHNYPIQERCSCGPQDPDAPVIFHRRGGPRCRAAGPS